MWNQYDDTDNKRSNNDIEGYNLWLSLWLHKHPNIWNFINKIKVEESSAFLKFLRINDGTFKGRSRSYKDAKRDEEILTCKFDLATKKISIMEYLNRVSKCIHEYGAKNIAQSTTSAPTDSIN